MIIKSLLLLAAVQGCAARLGVEKGKIQDRYPIRQRTLETKVITQAELDEFKLTFSFDTSPIPLPTFRIDIASTDGDLPPQSLDLLQDAMEKFIKDILKDQFHKVEKVKEVSATVASQESLGNSTHTFGSGLEYYVEVTFRTDPSPSSQEVAAKLESLMESSANMQGLVDIIVDMANTKPDPELQNVTQATRRGRSPSQNGSDPDGIRDDPSDNVQRDGTTSGIATIVPTAAASALLLAGIFFLVMRMRNNKDEKTEGVSNPRKSAIVLEDEESDIFSFERPPSSDPLSPDSIDSSQPSEIVVVEVDSEAGSSKGAGSSSFSFFLNNNNNYPRSGLGNSRRAMFTTPGTRVSLLHVYSEEEEEDLISIDDEHAESITSESAQSSQSPSQPYESITLDELLVSKYSSHEDVDHVSPVYASPRGFSPNRQKDKQSLEVHTDSDPRTIISGVTSPILSPPPTYYGQSPSSRLSPMTSPRPPLYKASPKGKSPAAQTASPQKPVANNSVLQESPDIWSTAASPRSPPKLRSKSPGMEGAGIYGKSPMRSAKNASPQHKAGISTPDALADIWSQKIITSPPKVIKTPEEQNQPSNGQSCDATLHLQIVSSDQTTVKPENGETEENQRDDTLEHPIVLHRTHTFVSDSWSNMTDPWTEKPFEDVEFPPRGVRSAGAKVRDRRSFEPQSFLARGAIPIRNVRSESPRKDRRSGRRPPAEVWEQNIFAQDRTAKDRNVSSPTLSNGMLFERAIVKSGSVSSPQKSLEGNRTLSPSKTRSPEKGTRVSPLDTSKSSRMSMSTPSPPKSSRSATSQWSLHNVVNAAAKAASSVGLSFGESRGNGEEIQDNLTETGSVDSNPSLPGPLGSEESLHGQALVYSRSFSPEGESANRNTSKRTSSEGQQTQGQDEQSSPGWLSRSKPDLLGNGQRLSSPGPGRPPTSLGSGSGRRKSAGEAASQKSPRLSHGRRHARFSAADGSMDYQQMLQQGDGNMSSFDAVSLSDSEVTGRFAASPASVDGSAMYSTLDYEKGQKLLMDLVWLEKKIAGQSGPVGQQRPSSPFSQDSSNTGLSDMSRAYNNRLLTNDSMSFASVDGYVDSETESVSEDQHRAAMSYIVCRDCYAPPGKLRIVIHSTKDGPAIHTVKKGSSLEGHLFTGDLIVSVDDIDTRGYTAEQVMRLMASRTAHERKITVLHFEKESPARNKRIRKSF